MTKTRLEAFSDGVIAILITIMVLELKVPHGKSWEELHPAVFTLLLYAMSYIYIGIYWNNHHHMLHVVQHVNGAVLWANLHLLFWLSLLPFVTAWSGENHFAPVPIALYGVVLLMAGIAYYILTRFLVRLHGRHSALAMAVGKDTKAILSVVVYAAAIPLAFVNQWVAFALYSCVTLGWFIPDRRIEKIVHEDVT